MAECIAGERLSDPGVSESVPVDELLKMKKVLVQSIDSDPYTRWAKWFFADRSTRAISPSSPI